MAFVNEYVSEEDIKKYGLEEINFRFNPQLRARGLAPSFRFMWTVDQERNIYFMRLKVGREDESNRSFWVLNYQGTEIEVDLERARGGSLTFSENPYRIIWELVRMKPDHIPGVVDRDELVVLLKAALTVYGNGGITHQVPNTLVTFNF